MSYKVLARRTRPQTFAEVVGQSATVNTLQRSLDKNKLHQAYLLTGTRGVGKTSIARILAKCMNCEQSLSSQPCRKCQACANIESGQFVDLIEIDAASHTKVEDIRAILDNIPYRPNNARYKIYLIDEVHMLSNHSFNALLKTLEEPPEYVKFILCTTDPQKLPATILSRCLRFHLHNLSPEEIKQHLDKILKNENINFDDAATLTIAEAADGSVRDSLSLLDQAIAFCDNDISSNAVNDMLGMSDASIITTLMQQIDQSDTAAALQTIAQMADQGENFQTATNTLMREYHKLAIKHALDKQKNTAENELVHLYYEITARALGDINQAPTLRIGFEMMVMRLIAFRPVANNTPINNSAHTTPVTTEKTPITTSSAASTNLTNPEFAWNNSFISQINLRGIAQEIAKNCSFIKKYDDSIELELNSQHAGLLNEKQRLRIQEAINSHLNSQLTLKININKTNNCASTTPHAEQTEQNSIEASRMNTSVQNDENSQRIIEAFNAEIVAGSIRSHKAPLTTTIGDENND
jgi:DNA polymerase III subunit gamma/tau